MGEESYYRASLTRSLLRSSSRSGRNVLTDVPASPREQALPAVWMPRPPLRESREVSQQIYGLLQNNCGGPFRRESLRSRCPCRESALFLRRRQPLPKRGLFQLLFSRRRQSLSSTMLLHSSTIISTSLNGGCPHSPSGVLRWRRLRPLNSPPAAGGNLFAASLSAGCAVRAPSFSSCCQSPTRPLAS